MSDLTQRLIEQGIRLHAIAPGNHKIVCPKCSGQRKDKRDPCLSVKIDDHGGAAWHCHHCQWSGNVPSRSSNAYQPSRPSAPVRPTVKPSEPTSELLAWFSARRIPEAIVKRNGIFLTRVWMPGPNAEIDAIAFPYRRGGELVNVKYRGLAQKVFRQEKGAEKILYGLDDTVAADTVIIVEGECDKLALEVAGFLNVVSVPDGAPATVRDDTEDGTKFSYLSGCAEFLDGKKIVIAVDTDAPGDALAEELARRLGKERCSRVRWPDGNDTRCKDANETLQHHGAEVLRECIANAEPWPVEGLHEASAFTESVFNLYRSGWSRGVSTGWKEIDQLMTIRPGEFSVVTGIPGSGKSELVDALAVNLAESQGWRFAMCSFENPPSEHLAKLAEKKTGVPFHAGPSVRMSEQELSGALQWVQRHFVFIRSDHDAAPTIDYVLARARAAVVRYGIRGLVIDPYNEIEAQRPRDTTETEYVSGMLSKVKRFAQNHGVHVWFIAHPAKPPREMAAKYVPTLYDISGSAHWVNKADLGVVIHRDRTPGSARVDIHVKKVRFKAVGQIGQASLRYDRVNGRYHAFDQAGSDDGTAAR